MPLGLRVVAIRFGLRPTARNAERFDRWAFFDFDQARRRNAECAMFGSDHDSEVSHNCRASCPPRCHALRPWLAATTTSSHETVRRQLPSPAASATPTMRPVELVTRRSAVVSSDFIKPILAL